MRVISYPKREKDTGPRRPSGWLTWWMPWGTVVENDGVVWEKVLVGAADQAWSEWVQVNLPKGMPKTPPRGPSGVSRPESWTKKVRR